jgi:hypothetical protein
MTSTGSACGILFECLELGREGPEITASKPDFQGDRIREGFNGRVTGGN